MLTRSQTNLCEWGGFAGIMLAATCLIQHLIVAIPQTVTNLMIPGYLLAIMAFLFLALKKMSSIALLIAGTVYIAIIEYLWISYLSFSVVVTLLCIYCIVMIVLIFSDQVPAALKAKRRAEKAEEDQWKGKI